jgi:hypothetical protein
MWNLQTIKEDMNLPQPPEHIKAEAFLSTFIRDEDDLDIEMSGVFSRNYNNDIIALDPSDAKGETVTVRLSRDSVFHILPENLFFEENKLRKLAKEKKTEKVKMEEERIRLEKQKICLFFKPFDTAYFKLLLRLEKAVNNISESRTRLLLDQFFDVFDLKTDNPLTRKVIPFLPLASEIRGNKKLLKDLLQCLYFPASVELYTERKRRPSGVTETVMKIIIHIENLSAKEFMTLQNNTNDFAGFFYEWFLPVDMGYEFKIKDTKRRFVLGAPITLDRKSVV